jgi:hypothetical protein
VEHLAAVVGVEEAAVADLAVFHEVNAQHGAARNEESLPPSRGDDDLFHYPQRPSASEWVFNSFVGSGARLRRCSQYAS